MQRSSGLPERAAATDEGKNEEGQTGEQAIRHNSRCPIFHLPEPQPCSKASTLDGLP